MVGSSRGVLAGHRSAAALTTAFQKLLSCRHAELQRPRVSKAGESKQGLSWPACRGLASRPVRGLLPRNPPRDHSRSPLPDPTTHETTRCPRAKPGSGASGRCGPRGCGRDRPLAAQSSQESRHRPPRRRRRQPATQKTQASECSCLLDLDSKEERLLSAPPARHPCSRDGCGHVGVWMSGSPNLSGDLRALCSRSEAPAATGTGSVPEPRR